ncbi:MAG: VCBS repeat-containing protein [Planctomycetes bacterium]|nr:VCBS repeat-containing protein [Planctomycetota bacterium]
MITTHLRGPVTCAATVLALVTTGRSQIYPATGTEYGGAAYPYAIATGDFNGDGRPDVVTSSPSVPGRVTLYLDNADGTLQPAIPFTVANSAVHLAVGDLNGDGNPDVATANANGAGSVSLLFGNGAGSLSGLVHLTVTGGARHIVISDVNNDGRLDLVTANSSGQVNVFIGNGNGTFAAAVAYAAGSSPSGVAVGDLDGDGLMDIVAANQNQARLSVLLGTGGGNFAAAVPYNASFPNKVVLADLDADGKLDAITCSPNTHVVSTMRGNGSGGFLAPVDHAVPAAGSPRSLAVGDVDHDGRLDVLSGHYASGRLGVFTGVGDGTLSLLSEHGSDYSPFGTAIADFNGDGRLDAATANYIGDSVSVFLNQMVCKQVQVPEGLVSASVASTTTAIRTTAFRSQMLYDATHFTNQGIIGPITICRLRFRAEDCESNLGGQLYANANVQLSTAAVDFQGMTTAFASNRGSDNTIVYSGPITVTPAGGAQCNDYVIAIDLATPFVYDPTSGNDLCVEIDAVAPAPDATSLVPLACSNNRNVWLARRLSVGDQTTPTGALSDVTPLLLIDFDGPGCPHPVRPTLVQKLGAGSYGHASSYYQHFDKGEYFDLRGSAGVANVIRMTLIDPDNYLVSSGPGAITPPTGTPYVGDDIVVPIALSSPIPYPGGSTLSLSACMNGFVWLGPNTSGAFTPSIADFLTQMPRLCAFWHDFHSGRNVSTHPGCGMYVEYLAGPTVQVTWQDIGEYNTVSATGGHSVSTLQMTIAANGDVEFRFGEMRGGLCGGITGFSRGNGATDPVSRDLSCELPVATNGPDDGNHALRLGLTELPSSPSTFQCTLENIPVGATLALFVYDFPAPNCPGLQPAYLAPRALQTVTMSAALLGPFIPTPVPTELSVPVTIPRCSLIGLPVTLQAAVLAGPFLWTSNALRFEVQQR